MAGRLLVAILLFISVAFSACMHTDAFLLDPDANYGPSERVMLLFSEHDGSSETLYPIAIVEVTSPALGNHSRSQMLNALRDKAQEVGADALFLVSSSQQYIPTTYTQNIDGSLLTIPGGYENKLIGIALRDKSRAVKPPEYSRIESTMNNQRPKPASASTTKLGLNLNVLTLPLNGLGGSVWLGSNHIRGAVDLYKVNIPEAMTRDGFNEGKVDVAYRFSFDYLFLGNLGGPYFGSGFQYASYSISHQYTDDIGYWESLDLIISLGYLIVFPPHIHFDIRLALDAVIYGEEMIMVGRNEMYPDNAKVYGSIGFGINF